MELRHLRYFVGVAETENVSRAALRLHVSQPALSRQIRDLEDEIGVGLFERSAKAVRLTEAGRTFLLEARAVIDRANAAIAAARAVATGRRGELHVGYAPTPTSRFMPGALRLFQAAQPEVRVKLHDLSTEEMLTGLRDRELHIAFLVRPTGAMLRGLTFSALLDDPVRVAAAPSHPLARLRSVSPTRLAQESLLAFNRKQFPEYHALLAEVFAATKQSPRIAEEHESGTSLVAAVEAGYGVAVLAESITCTTGRRLKLLPLTPAAVPLVVGAAWRKGALSPAAERFLHSAKDAAAAVRREEEKTLARRPRIAKPA